MTDEELIEAVAAEVSCHLWATIAVGNSDDCGDFPEMPAYAQEIYRDAARAVIPVAQAPKDARIAELEKALSHIDALDPEHSRMGSIGEEAAKGLVLRMGEIARHALRSTQ